VLRAAAPVARALMSPQRPHDHVTRSASRSYSECQSCRPSRHFRPRIVPPQPSSLTSLALRAAPVREIKSRALPGACVDVRRAHISVELSAIIASSMTVAQLQPTSSAHHRSVTRIKHLLDFTGEIGTSSPDVEHPRPVRGRHHVCAAAVPAIKAKIKIRKEIKSRRSESGPS
jgi:hypothetical protein